MKLNLAKGVIADIYKIIFSEVDFFKGVYFFVEILIWPVFEELNKFSSEKCFDIFGLTRIRERIGLQVRGQNMVCEWHNQNAPMMLIQTDRNVG